MKKNTKSMRTRRTKADPIDSPTASTVRTVNSGNGSSRHAHPGFDEAPLPCVKCGRKGVAVWKCCADMDWRVLCVDCDVEANEWLLRFMNVSQPTRRLNRYREKMDVRPVTRARMIRCGMLSVDGSMLRF